MAGEYLDKTVQFTMKKCKTHEDRVYVEVGSTGSKKDDLFIAADGMALLIKAIENDGVENADGLSMLEHVTNMISNAYNDIKLDTQSGSFVSDVNV